MRGFPWLSLPTIGALFALLELLQNLDLGFLGDGGESYRLGLRLRLHLNLALLLRSKELFAG